MIVVLKSGISRSDLERLKQKLREYGCDFTIHENGEPILRIHSQQNLLSKDFFLSQPGVENVFRITSSYPLAARKTQAPFALRVGDIQIRRPRHFAIIAGPCAVESEEQIFAIAQELSRDRDPFPSRRRLQTTHVAVHVPGAGRGRLELLRRAGIVLR